MEPIKWSEIEAECGDFRAGFVATFRKYEGQPTDEKDGQSRTIKVTARSFAIHVGIPEDTFRRWIKREQNPQRAGSAPRSAKDLTRDVTRAARHEPEAVVAGVMAAPEATQDRIFHELKLARAERPGGSLHGLNTDRSPAHRKAVEAQVGDMTEPFHRLVVSSGTVAMAEVLDELADDLRAAITKDVLTGEQFAKIDAAHDRFAIVLAEARILLGVAS